MTTGLVLVAPREIVDVVARASQVLSCEASLASSLAQDITYCQVHHGNGVKAFLQLVTQGPEVFVSTLKKAQELQVSDRYQFSWTNPIPFALLARLLNERGNQGFIWEDQNAAATGTDLVPGLELVAGSNPSGTPNVIQQALAQGVALEKTTWVSLGEIARSFLTAEATLDANQPVEA